MDKLFHIVSDHQWAQGRLSLFPEFNTEIFWDFYGFGDDCVAWEEIGIHFHIANGEWLVQGRLNLPFSIILRMGIGLHGFGEEFGDVGEG